MWGTAVLSYCPCDTQTICSRYKVRLSLWQSWFFIRLEQHGQWLVSFCRFIFSALLSSWPIQKWVLNGYAFHSYCFSCYKIKLCPCTTASRILPRVFLFFFLDMNVTGTMRLQRSSSFLQGNNLCSSGSSDTLSCFNVTSALVSSSTQWV